MNMSIWIVSGTLGFVAGSTVVWFFKERIQALVIDANTLSAKLHAKADKIKNL